MKDSILTFKPASLPSGIRTGDPAIDAYLGQINAHLIGTSRIRRATLAEARDFVLDASAGARDHEAGINAAIDEFGSPRDIGNAQRRERRGIFLKIALMTGPAFAVLMLIASLLGLPSADGGWGVRAVVFMWNMLSFGLGMGAIFAYVYDGSSPSAATPEVAAGEEGFVVAYRKSSRVLCWILIGVFGPLQLLVLLGLLDADPTGIFNAWSWPLAVFILVVGLKNVGAPLHALAFRAQASPGELVVHRLTGLLQLSRQQIITITKPGYLSQFFSMMFGRQHKIGWRAEDGSLHHFTLSITPDVINGDRLLAWLEAAVRDNRPPR